MTRGRAGAESVYCRAFFLRVSGSDSQVDNKISALNQQFGNAMPKSARLAMECRRPDMQSPCRQGQKWHCVLDGGRWRKHKCKFQRNCICSTPKGFLYAKLENYDRGAHKHFYGCVSSFFKPPQDPPTEEKNPLISYRKTDRRYMDVFRNRRTATSARFWGAVPTTVDYSTLLSIINRSNNLKRRRKRESADDDISAIVDDLEQELSEAEVGYRAALF